MNLYLKYNLEQTCRIILEEQLDKFGFPYTITDTGCVYFPEPIPIKEYAEIHQQLAHYGICIVDNRKAIMVQKVKSLIDKMLTNFDTPLVKISAYLSKELDENYRTIAQVFSDVCYVSIETYIILKKIEKVKQLLTSEDMSLTEIAFKLNYSSVAHLSNQFKKMTGLTPTTFQKLTLHRRHFKTAVLN